ncbi:MAG: cyclase family protein [Candidatus Magasanikbacteria bacterium]|jgi:kynurenine formamidase|nr:cyclase family protein [Candidatus Magasanikbacteria bacterium]MBT4071962.1 cyclase family protein [Candidatus Magasanikbacteria bacterium]
MIYDLTLAINKKISIFPGDPKLEITQSATIEKDGYNEKRISFNTHFGTHIDFPQHMLKDGKTLSDYPIEKFIGKGIVLDAKDKNINEINLDKIKKDDFVFFYTGHIDKIYSDNFFKESPTLSKEFTKKLVEKEISIIGLDSYSPDNAPYEIHKILLKNDILIVENLVNLDKLIGKRFTCYIAPLHIEHSDGSPCRVIALI